MIFQSVTQAARKKRDATFNMSQTYDLLVDYSKVLLEGRFALTRGYVLNYSGDYIGVNT